MSIPKKTTRKKDKESSQNKYSEIHLKEGEVLEITKDMIIGDILIAYPEVLEVMEEMNIHCFACHLSQFESVEEGAIVHGIDPQLLCDKMNETIRAHRKTQ